MQQREFNSCSENRTNQVNTLGRQNLEYLSDKLEGALVSALRFEGLTQ
jgi:hypothetical protein